MGGHETLRRVYPLFLLLVDVQYFVGVMVAPITHHASMVEAWECKAMMASGMIWCS